MAAEQAEQLQQQEEALQAQAQAAQQVLVINLKASIVS